MATSDAEARAAAVDPSRNIVLEASAGTGKTRVLVERYVNLLRAGVEPDHILAVTFTRKAAAEMRERIIERLREAGRLSQLDLARWRDLKPRLDEIAISTIDAFCLSLLHEFPLEADVDPGFDLADDTEIPRLISESLDQALRICRSIAREDDDVALVFAQLGERRLRTGLSHLLNRRLVAPQALRRYLARGPRDLTPASVCRATAERLRDAMTGGEHATAVDVEPFLADGPIRHPQFAMLAEDLRRLTGDIGRLGLDARDGQAVFRSLIDRLRSYFLTQEGRPRGERFAGTIFRAEDCRSDATWARHRRRAAAMAPAVAEAIHAFRRDLNVILSRGVWRLFSVTLSQYQRTLDARRLLDFSGVLERAVKLLKDMDEFAESRFRLEARYRHVLVDEFQDTSRAQWALVSQLVRSWGEGVGASTDALPPSIFIVGDRKQSIYGFRDADVAVMDDAARFVGELRPTGGARHAISVSFRAVPGILSFVNDVCGAVEKAPDRRDGFRYDADDRFPNRDREAPRAEEIEAERPLGILVGESIIESADRVAAEVGQLIGRLAVRDRTKVGRRPAQAADIAILFRSRDTHREFEKALERRGVPTYVYKGLGFFDAEEVQDAVALLRFLADPTSNLRAATLLRSRLVRLSDAAIMGLAPLLANALLGPDLPSAAASFDAEDRYVLEQVRLAIPGWLALVDRLPPSELLARVLTETAYVHLLAGRRSRQARENLKKLSAMIRRFQNRGYATLARVADHLEQLAVGDESNAALDALDAVSLMTVHAAKGLEFPVVFLVNLGRGTGNTRAPIRIADDPTGEASVAVADYQSDADEDAVAREREETKRLLYVALTRARDRLYLSGSLANGTFRATRGSLGEVFPPSLKSVFAQAIGARGGIVTWRGPDGAHEFLVPDMQPASAKATAES